MESFSSETVFPLSAPTQNPNPNPNPSFSTTTPRTKKKKKQTAAQRRREAAEWPRKGKKGGNSVTLEGYVEVEGGDGGLDSGSGAVGRTKSLTDEDLEELKGCLDLGFGFSYEEIPELCNTLPALELCYSMSQRFLDEQHHQHHQHHQQEAPCSPASPSPMANWKISSPGDSPDEVKAKLKYWAQAVACTVRLCS